LKKLSNKTFPGIRGKGNRYTVTKGILLSLFFELKPQKMIKNEAKVFLLHLSFFPERGGKAVERATVPALPPTLNSEKKTQ